MREVRGDLWTYPTDWRVITTNGSVKRDGCCVMGRGCAYEAARQFLMLPQELGNKIQKRGNHVYAFAQYKLLTFPVKHEWFDNADVDLIARSVDELKVFLDPKLRYVMPRAGCGNGRLSWDTVKPLLETLPDNVRVVHFPYE